MKNLTRRLCISIATLAWVVPDALAGLNFGSALSSSGCGRWHARIDGQDLGARERKFAPDRLVDILCGRE